MSYGSLLTGSVSYADTDIEGMTVIWIDGDVVGKGERGSCLV